MFDSDRFNGFVKNELDDCLFNDIWNYWVFNERDLHAAAYFYMREYFRKKGSQNATEILVRCEPVMDDFGRPDIVVFQSYAPIYIIELKMFREPEVIKEDQIDQDLGRLKSYIEKYPSIKWGFLIVVYDSEEMWKPTGYMLKKSGYKQISVSSINLRRKEDSGYRRKDYDQWRKQFDKFCNRYLEKHP